MRQTEILIVGGGLAGSTATAMLARAGFDTVLVDPKVIYPPDLRCEKVAGVQVDILRRTGLAELVLPAATFDGQCWIARYGHVIEKRPGDQYGILYDALVNVIRQAIPAGSPFACGKVSGIGNSGDRQLVALSSGEVISARLVVLANGLNVGLLRELGMRREDVSKCHSVTLAFDLLPVGRSSFEFPALTYHPEHPADRYAYVTLFPIGQTMRANVFFYRAMDDPWVREMREDPVQAMRSVMPGLGKLIGTAEVPGPVKIWPADLYVTRDYLKPGIVLVGDAFASSCPAAGTGSEKVFNDVERLCNVYVPRWMASDGMGVEKISAFYADPLKRACDRRSFERAFSVRSLAMDEGWFWRINRAGRFVAGLAIEAARHARAEVRANLPIG